MYREPEHFDVVVAPNMYGDIIRSVPWTLAAMRFTVRRQLTRAFPHYTRACPVQ